MPNSSTLVLYNPPKATLPTKIREIKKKVSQIVFALLDEEIMLNKQYVKMCARISAFQKVPCPRPNYPTQLAGPENVNSNRKVLSYNT